MDADAIISNLGELTAAISAAVEPKRARLAELMAEAEEVRKELLALPVFVEVRYPIGANAPMTETAIRVSLEVKL